MSSSPSFTYCPAGVWTTIFRGVLPFIGYFKVYTGSNPAVAPDTKFEYSAWSISPIWAASGTKPAYAETQIWIGPTGYAELKVKTNKNSQFKATGI